MKENKQEVWEKKICLPSSPDYFGLDSFVFLSKYISIKPLITLLPPGGEDQGCDGQPRQGNRARSAARFRTRLLEGVEANDNFFEYNGI
jgi:hypothetical protein